jgi:hypothetical protein
MINGTVGVEIDSDFAEGVSGSGDINGLDQTLNHVTAFVTIWEGSDRVTIQHSNLADTSEWRPTRAQDMPDAGIRMVAENSDIETVAVIASNIDVPTNQDDSGAIWSHGASKISLLTIATVDLKGNIRHGADNDGAKIFINGLTQDCEASEYSAIALNTQEAHLSHIVQRNCKKRGLSMWCTANEACGDVWLSRYESYNGGSNIDDDNGGIVDLKFEAAVDRFFFSYGHIEPATHATKDIHAVDCAGDPESYVDHVYVKGSDGSGIYGCTHVSESRIIDSTLDGIAMLAGNAWGKLKGNYVEGAGDDSFALATVGVALEGNESVDPTGVHLDEGTGTAYTRCLNNVGRSTTLTEFNVTNANLTGGTPLVGDVYTNEGGGTPEGVLVSVDLSGDPNYFVAIPDDVTTDDLHTGMNIDETGGTGWDMNNITVTQDATRGGLWGCDTEGSSESGSIEIPAD